MRNNSRLPILIACVLLGAAACAGGTASKRGARVVVMPIAGSSDANGAVSDVVSSRYELVSPKRYAKTARKLDAKSKDEKDIRKVSRKLDIDALVHGEFVKRGKRKYELRLSLRAGASGEEFESVTVKLRSKKLSRSDRSKIKEKLYEALSEVDDWGDDEQADQPEKASRSRRSKSGSNDEERERARKIREKNQEKELRDEDKRLARAEKKEEKRERKSSKKKRDDDDDDDDDQKTKSSKSSKSKSKKSRSNDDDDDRRSKKDDDDRRSKKDDDDRRAKKDDDEKRAKKKKDASYKVITVRDDEGQALDNESPF